MVRGSMLLCIERLQLIFHFGCTFDAQLPIESYYNDVMPRIQFQLIYFPPKCTDNMCIARIIHNKDVQKCNYALMASQPTSCRLC